MGTRGQRFAQYSIMTLKRRTHSAFLIGTMIDTIG